MFLLFEVVDEFKPWKSVPITYLIESVSGLNLGNHDVVP